MNSRVRDQRGFTFIELLIVVTILSLIFMSILPFYRRYVAQTELNKTTIMMRNVLRSAHNKSLNGVASSDGTTVHWVVHIHNNSTQYEYEVGGCPVNTDSGSGTYTERYQFMNCGNKDYLLADFPQRFSVTHQYSASYPEVNIFYANINGDVTVYSSNGSILGTNIDIKISSDDYENLFTIFHVNAKGGISEETVTN
ncbi:MAG: prepilin-type N-terminal cleavage/methylation domain-containing protein [bacterium]|nr:prepilin-type N-terminal cleavage/methylation domain-containing protein [bacterium]